MKFCASGIKKCFIDETLPQKNQGSEKKLAAIKKSDLQKTDCTSLYIRELSNGNLTSTIIVFGVSSMKHLYNLFWTDDGGFFHLLGEDLHTPKPDRYPSKRLTEKRNGTVGFIAEVPVFFTTRQISVTQEVRAKQP